MKIQRLNKRSKTTRDSVKSIQTTKTEYKYVDPMIGRSVRLISLPTYIKRAKRLFEVDKIYTVQKPENNYINTESIVNLKGSDGKLYHIFFTNWVPMPQ